MSLSVLHRLSFAPMDNARLFSCSTLLAAKRWREKSVPTYKSKLRNPVAEVAPRQVREEAENGLPYDRKPFKVRVQKFHEYTWCGCGWARTAQPFCDGACQCQMYKKIMKGGPVKYIAPETQDVWFCNCKQTTNRPFCDGTHRSDEIQAMKFGSGVSVQLWEPKGEPQSM